MQADSELFSEAVRAKNLGDRLPDISPVRLNTLFQQQKELVDRHIDAFRRSWQPAWNLPKLPRVVVDYVDSPSAEAYAFKYNDSYIIAVYYGLILVLEFMFDSLLSNRQFLPEIGSPQAERDDLPVIPIMPSYDAIASGLSTHGLNRSDFIPKGEERRGVANFLTVVSIHFMFGHEFRHIQAGHADYYHDGLNLAYISEYASTGNPIDVAMKKQAMEWDCDRFAFHAELDGRWHTRAKALQSPSAFAHFYLDSKLLFFLCMLACSGFFRLLDDDKPPRPLWSTRSHPPSRIRRGILLNTGLVWGELRYPHEFGESARFEIADRCAREIEILLSSLGASHFDRDYSILVSTQAVNHESEIMAAWQSILGKLATYTHVPLSQLPL